MPTPHHLYRATSEDAGSQSAPNTHFPILYSQPPVNFTELPLPSYKKPDLVDPLAGQCQQQNWTLPTALEPKPSHLPLHQRDLGDNRNINALSPTSLYNQNNDHRMKLSISYHGSQLAGDGKYATLVGAKVKPRGIRISDNKAKHSGSKPPTKTL
ncbi:hypothetical protein N7527_009188 [Penicillium freii]|nr:hypothetical protein N7527_009188 [Penicillium freii]